MEVYDFEYDHVRLSDRGMMICKFDSDDTETVSNGSEITFNTVATLNGNKHELTSGTYEECLTATFQICKHPCMYNDADELSVEDVRNIMRWLNRKTFHKLKFLNDEYTGFYYEASFNVSRIERNGKTFGLELEMITNRPFALQEQVVISIDNAVPNDVKKFFSKSDEEGHIYPNMTIKIMSDGDLEVHSLTENRTMKILNCKSGELINIDYPIITSSLGTHKIQNDFNWVFYRITTSFKNRANELSISLPCFMTIKYNPIVKIGV